MASSGLRMASSCPQMVSSCPQMVSSWLQMVSSWLQMVSSWIQMVSSGLDKQLLVRLRRDFATTPSLFGPGRRRCRLTYWSPEASYREFNNSRHICI